MSLLVVLFSIPRPRAGLEPVFAEKTGREALWKQKLEGWNVEESTVVNEWFVRREAPLLLRMGARRFGPAPEEVEAAIRAITKPDRMERMIERIHEAADWADLLTTP